MRTYRRRLVLRAVAVCAAVTASAYGLAAPPAAQAATVVTSGVVISGMAGGCMDVNGNSGANGATVDLWDCNGSGAQIWQLMSDGSMRINGKCLDVNNGDTANGTKVQLWDCSGNSNQGWHYASGQLVNVNSGRCLDDPDGTIDSGTSLMIWDCWGGPNQQWSQPSSVGLPGSALSSDAPGASLSEVAASVASAIAGLSGAATAAAGDTASLTAALGQLASHPAPSVQASGAVTSGVAGGCLDDNGNNGANGATVDVWNCNGSAAQSWQLMSDGSLRINGRCLDVNGADNANGTTVQLWDCSGNSNQQWTYNSSEELVNTNSGRCLDDPGGAINTGASLQIWDCWGGVNQRWSTPGGSLAEASHPSGQGPNSPPFPFATASGAVTSGVAGGCLDDNGNSGANGATVEVWGCNGSGAQNWQLMSDGTMRINGKCLDVNNGTMANGTRVQLWDCTGNTNQQWIYNGANELVNVNSGRCLDDPSGAISTGASLQIWDCWGGVNQRWSVPGSVLSGGGGGGGGGGGSAGPVTITNPGGDLVISLDDGGLAANAVTQALSTTLPESLGLADNASVDSIIHAMYNRDSAQGAALGLPTPPSLPDASISVSGGTVTLTVPAADIQQVSAASPAFPLWAAALISTTFGVIAGIAGMALCLATTLVVGPIVSAVCGGFSTFINFFAYYVLYYILTGTPFTADRWAAIVISSLGGALLAGMGGFWVTPWLARTFPGLINSMSAPLGAALQSFGTSWWASETTRVVIGFGSVITTTVGLLAAVVLGIAASLGIAHVVGGPGPVYSGITGKCLDALGGTSSPGTIVDLWDCNGSGPQYWTVWSNNSVTFDGECMEAAGGGTANSTPVQLADCDGSSGQQWVKSGNTLVNQGSGRCLDDPGGATLNGTQQFIYDCWGGVNQRWTLPAVPGS